MTLNTKIAVLGAVLCTVVANIISQNSLPIIFLNGASVLVLLLAFTNSITTQSKVFLVLVGCLPIFWYSTPHVSSSLALFVISSGTLLIAKLSRLAKILAPIFLLLAVYLSLVLHGVVSWPDHYHADRTIFDEPTTKDAISLHQKDARFVPYKARLLLFNQSIYPYVITHNIFQILSVKNVIDILLLANLYPLALGAVRFARNKLTSLPDKFLLGVASVNFLILGLTKSGDKYYSLLLVMPLLVNLLLLGLQSINQRVYIVILILSALLITRPII